MDFNEAISYNELYDSMLRCKNGVTWKSTVAHILLNSVEQISKLADELEDGTYKSGDMRYFPVYRPKKRDIASVPFRDRIVQRSLNDNIIFPECAKHLIYDNCACQKGKGTKFARDRLKEHLRSHYRKHGSDGYVLLIDIKGYYPNMRHDAVKDMFRRYFSGGTLNTIFDVLDKYDSEIGFNPGSQLIQIAGITLLNDIDHRIKERYHMRHCLRYMDDFRIIAKSKHELLILKDKIEKDLAEYGFSFNEKKTKIIPIHYGIPFLGFRFILTGSGKVLAFVLPEKVKDDKRNIRKIAKMVADGKMTEDNYYTSYKSRRAHYEYGDSFNLIKRMDEFVKKELENAKSRNSILA